MIRAVHEKLLILDHAQSTNKPDWGPILERICHEVFYLIYLSNERRYIKLGFTDLNALFSLQERDQEEL